MKRIIPRNVPPRAPNAKIPALSILKANTDPVTPAKRLTISAVQFNPSDELDGITASQIINEIANPKMKPVMSRVTLRNFKPKKHKKTPKRNIIITHIHLLLLRSSQRDDKSIVGQPADELTVRR